MKKLVLVIGVVIALFLILNAVLQSHYSIFIDFGNTYQTLPNYLAFVATTVSVYFLYITFSTQRRANQISAFESRFFKFMDYHRENVSQLKYRDPKDKNKEYWEGNQVFTVIYYEISELLKRIRALYPESSREQLVRNIDLSYQCVFYGAGRDGLPILKRRFSEFNFKAIKFEDELAAYSTKEQNDDGSKRYYSGHIRRLGHYFRNIYQAVKYIETQDFLTEEQKYEYTAHFRAQFSVYEQAVFFLIHCQLWVKSGNGKIILKSCPLMKLQRKRFLINY